MPDYSLIIAEDEEDIRNGLANVIDWEAIGFKVKGTFDNGRKAMDFLGENDVDVVVTDIVMPDFGGLDFAEWLKRNKPDTRTVILSGYSEFNYARQAIKLGVKYYLLKPTNVDELNAAFLQIRGELDVEKQKKDREKEQLKKQEKLNLFYQTSILNKIFSEEITDEYLINAALKISGLSAYSAGNGWWFCIMSVSDVQGFDYQDNIAVQQKGVETVFNALNSNNTLFSAIPVSGWGNRMYSVIWPKTLELLAMEHVDNLNCVIRKKISGLKSLLGLDINVESLSYFENLSVMVKNTVNIRRSLSGNTSVDFGDILITGTRQRNKMGAIKEAIRKNELNTLKEIIEKIRTDLHNESMSAAEDIGMLLVQELRINLVRRGLEIPEILNDESVYRSIVLADNCETLADYYRQVVYEYELHCCTPEKLGVRKTMEYVKEHVCEEVVISDIASYVYLNPSYLCRMFKKETGENLSDYIIRKKIEKAREYLKNPKYKVYQVGSMIGYHDVRYFYKIFKKITGLTPQEYRNNRNA